MAFILKHWRVVAVLAVCLAGIGLYVLGRHDGKSAAIAEAAKATIQAINKRAAINEKFDGMDAVRICLELGGMHPDCEQLRGMATDKP